LFSIENRFPKLNVAGSIPVSRSKLSLNSPSQLRPRSAGQETHLS